MLLRCSTCFGTKKTLGLGMIPIKCPACDGAGQIEQQKKEITKEIEEIKEFDTMPKFVPPSKKEMLANGNPMEKRKEKDKRFKGLLKKS